MSSHSLVRGNQQQRWRSQQSANGYGSSSDEHHRPSRWPGVPRPLYRPPEEDLYSPWRMFEERVRTGPFGLSRFPSQPHSPVRILVLDGYSDDQVSPRLTQFIRNSPPRIRGEWHLGGQVGPALEEAEDPGLSEEEFKKAMKKLRRQVYNPPYPRRRAWKRGLFSSRTNSSGGGGGGGGIDEEEKEDGKDCTICLEAFMANEQVLVTPCNHMFHSDCLVPWVKSQGKCPVCRHVLCEKRENALVRSSNNSGGGNFGYGYTSSREFDDELASDLITLIRAMEEAFNWVSYSRVTPHH